MYLSNTHIQTLTIFYGYESSDTDPVGGFSPSVLVWPILAFGHIQLFRFPNICVVAGG